MERNEVADRLAKEAAVDAKELEEETSVVRVKSGKFGHQVNSDTHLQTVEIQM